MTRITDIFRLNNTVFTLKDIALLWHDTDAQGVRKKINYYVKKGELYSIRKGIYAKDEKYDRLEFATKIYTPSYVSIETVLQKEGIIFQYYSQIFVISYLSRELTCDKQTYVFKKIRNPILTNTNGLEKGRPIATKERAFLDAIYIYKEYHFDNLATIDWDRCFDLAPIYNNKALLKRLNRYYKEYA